MRQRRYAWFAAVVVLLFVGHEVLLRVLAREHVAHVLLGAGNGVSSVLAAIGAAVFVVLRIAVVVVLPGALPFVIARYVFRATEERR